jgi:hypothetical protein
LESLLLSSEDLLRESQAYEPIILAHVVFWNVSKTTSHIRTLARSLSRLLIIFLVCAPTRKKLVMKPCYNWADSVNNWKWRHHIWKRLEMLPFKLVSSFVPCKFVTVSLHIQFSCRVCVPQIYLCRSRKAFHSKLFLCFLIVLLLGANLWAIVWLFTKK